MNVSRVRIVHAKRTVELEAGGGRELNLRPTAGGVYSTKVGSWVQWIAAVKNRLTDSSTQAADGAAAVKLAGDLNF